MGEAGQPRLHPLPAANTRIIAKCTGTGTECGPGPGIAANSFRQYGTANGADSRTLGILAWATTGITGGKAKSDQCDTGEAKGNGFSHDSPAYFCARQRALGLYILKIWHVTRE